MLRPRVEIPLRELATSALAALVFFGAAALSPRSGAAAEAEALGVFKVGTLTIEAPWTRATPAGAKVAGGYVRITNEGKDVDRLIGGALVGAQSGAIHEMRTEGGVMRMRPLEKGLQIKPGSTVELAPGGTHVMFTGLARNLKEGDRVQGTLIFEKAGTVLVEFAVRSIGASGAPMPGPGEQR